MANLNYIPLPEDAQEVSKELEAGNGGCSHSEENTAFTKSRSAQPTNGRDIAVIGFKKTMSPRRRAMLKKQLKGILRDR